jgi:transcriptional regulator with XRE-family HTH domain
MEIIRHLRERRGLSFSDMEARTGLARSHLCNSEKPTAEPRIATLRKIAGALGIDVVTLVAAYESERAA